MPALFDAHTSIAMVFALATSLFVSLLLVLTKKWHGFLSFDSKVGVQKFHSSLTPRIGGIALVAAACVSVMFTTDVVDSLMLPLVYAALPAYFFGFAEDITKRVGVLSRLLATATSAFLGWWLSGYTLTSLDVWGLDELMTLTTFSVGFTVFAAAGMTNAINIIDGFNGLASLTGFWGLSAYSFMALQMGDTALSACAATLAACVLGFFCVNWPLGKLFLGDGGSYFLGFSIAWVAVMLIARNPKISAFSVLMVTAYPFVEVLFSIYRRYVRGQSPGKPDRLHFHSLVKRRYVAHWFKGRSQLARNSITGLIVGTMSLTPALLAVATYSSVLWSALCLLGLFLGYITIYARMVRHYWCSPVAFLLGRRKTPTNFFSVE